MRSVSPLFSSSSCLSLYANAHFPCPLSSGPLLTILTSSSSHSSGSFRPAALHTSPPVPSLPLCKDGASSMHCVSIVSSFVPPSSLDTLKCRNTKLKRAHAIFRYNWQAISCVTRGREGGQAFPSSSSSSYALPQRRTREGSGGGGRAFIMADTCPPVANAWEGGRATMNRANRQANCQKNMNNGRKGEWTRDRGRVK